MTGKTIIKSEEAAEFLGVTIAALRQMRHEKKVPYYKNRTGRRVYYVKEELAEWMLAFRVPTKQELEQRVLREMQ